MVYIPCPECGLLLVLEIVVLDYLLDYSFCELVLLYLIFSSNLSHLTAFCSFARAYSAARLAIRVELASPLIGMGSKALFLTTLSMKSAESKTLVSLRPLRLYGKSFLLYFARNLIELKPP